MRSTIATLRTFIRESLSTGDFTYATRADYEKALADKRQASREAVAAVLRTPQSAEAMEGAERAQAALDALMAWGLEHGWLDPE